MARFMIAVLVALSPAVVALADSDWAPCGGRQEGLWSWAWVGDQGANVETLSGDKEGVQRVTMMYDLSGNGHHYYNDESSGTAGRPYYDSNGLDTLHTYGTRDWGTYYTPLIPIMRDNLFDGTAVYGQSLRQLGSLNAAGSFYTAFAGLNSRSNGSREMFGSNGQDYLALDQERNRIRIVLSGDSVRVTEQDAIPAGPVVIELWRDTSNVVHVWANGEPVGNGSVVSGVWDMSGFGYKGSGTSGWDDYALELIVCNALPVSDQRGEIREYLRAKWGLYGELPDPPARPKAPENLQAD